MGVLAAREEWRKCPQNVFLVEEYDVSFGQTSSKCKDRIKIFTDISETKTEKQT